MAGSYSQFPLHTLGDELFWRHPSPRDARPVEAPQQLPAPNDYTFDAHEAVSEIKAGEAYFEKGNFAGAALRFREATKWNPQSAMAYFRLSEALEKTKDTEATREAQAKYLELTLRGVK